MAAPQSVVDYEMISEIEESRVKVVVQIRRFFSCHCRQRFVFGQLAGIRVNLDFKCILLVVLENGRIGLEKRFVAGLAPATKTLGLLLVRAQVVFKMRAPSESFWTHVASVVSDIQVHFDVPAQSLF